MSQEFIKIAQVGDLSPGQMKLVRIPGRRILLCNYEGTYYAVDAICTHENGLLSRGLFYGHEVVCPLHGAAFDVRTGEVTTPPAMEGLIVYPVRVQGDDILVASPAE